MKIFKEYCKINNIKPTKLEFLIFLCAKKVEYKHIKLQNNKLIFS